MGLLSRSLVVFSLWGFAVGCIIPYAVPVRQRVTTYPGGGGLDQKLELKFIQRGVTTREEVERRLEWADMKVGVSRFFWGRWSQSRWLGGVMFEPLEPHQQGAHDKRRFWGTRNLFVDFSTSGVVLRSEVVPEQSLLTALASRAVRPEPYEGQVLVWRRRPKGSEPPRDYSEKAVLRLSFKYLSLLGPTTKLTVPRALIRDFQLEHDFRRSAELKLRFKKRTAVGKFVKLTVEPNVLLALVEYVGVKQLRAG